MKVKTGGAQQKGNQKNSGGKGGCAGWQKGPDNVAAGVGEELAVKILLRNGNLRWTHNEVILK